MTNSTKAAVFTMALALGAAPLAMAQTPANRAAPETAAADHTVHVPGTMVYFRDGVQYDVPNHLMGRHGLLINGVPPQPAEFD